MGELTREQLVSGLLFQIVLVVVLSLLARFIWAKGVKRYSVFG
jgi:ABC-2 type transport system permease protein